jgi:Lipocalin-like domain
MRRVILWATVGVFAIASCFSAQSKQASADAQTLVGTWKLVSYVRQESPSGTKSNVMGDHPSGYLNYGVDGRMMVMIAGSERKKPAGTVAMPDEAQALIQSMLAYAGTYTIDSEAKTVTHHIDISWDQARTGTDNVRSYKLEGNRLMLTTDPSTDPGTGQQTVRALVWEKLK